MPTITRASDRRVHITNPRDWATSGATDFWCNFSDPNLIPAGSFALENYGWVESGAWTTLVGVDGDLLSSSDTGITGGANLGTGGDGITSPYIFGDYAHGTMAGAFLGYDPTTLNFECYARFAANFDEESSGFGFSEESAAEPAVKAGHMAFITTDGTNFSLESGAAEAVSDGLDNTAAHVWRVTLTAGGAVTWAIDGVEQTNTLALQTDLFPVAWGAACQTLNDPVINWVHIWYS